MMKAMYWVLSSLMESRESLHVSEALLRSILAEDLSASPSRDAPESLVLATILSRSAFMMYVRAMVYQIAAADNTENTAVNPDKMKTPIRT